MIVNPELLALGELSLHGRLVAASNGTYQGSVSLAGETATVVYKPVEGERPLWDFPDGTLAQREFAAYVVSEALGWSVVPPTLLRDGPLGEGMVQLWIDEAELNVGETELVDIVPQGRVPKGWVGVLEALDGRHNPVTLVHADNDALRRMAVFDAVVNNADRKGGHVLNPGDGRVYGVDHGVTFNADDKLRTVLWGWAGDPIPADLLADVRRLADELAGGLGQQLCELITAVELTATRERCATLLKTGAFPYPSDEWPAIPWPAF
ncbi:SCO1664 family protein [Kribbella kalugense]|uniref:Putative repeat protein (TIGR03843 family) n=1 Tax=Kribbella kalugense TaxID=2512221 RepID=A0A4R8A1X0_9ACTN|nr:SCO1664 family protein [Kribbella kalugense]TDW22150.1 putative repeat protein (TIGR03843 family) [Kribbella kalugense]